MNICKRIALLALALTLAFSAVSCGEGEKETLTETKELSATEQAALDEKYLKQFIKDYRAGKYKEKQMFLYDDYSQFLELAEYEGMKYPDDAMLDKTVSEEAVTDYLTGIQLVGILKDDAFEEITEGTVKKFDTVTMDFKGYIDGEEMENGSGTDQELLIGSNQFIAGFETGLIGKNIGEEVVLDLKFSPYYSGADVAGKDVKFHVTVKKVSRAKEIPELTVEEINALYDSDFSSMDAVREDIQSFLENEKKDTAYSSLANYLQQNLMKNSKIIDYPITEVEYYRKHYIEYYSQEKEAGQTIDEFCEEVLGVSYEEFDADALAYAREAVSGTIMLLSVAQKENITCSDEQLEAIILGLYQSQGSYYGNLESFVVDYIDIYGADYFENRVVTASAVEAIVEKAEKEN